MSDYRVYDSEVKPISPWGYIGYQVLFSIPVVGFIIAIILALTSSNVNVKNYARSQFCIILLVIVLCVLLGAMGVLSEVLEVLKNR